MTNTIQYFALFAARGTGHFRTVPVADIWRFTPHDATLDQFNTISGTQSIPGIKDVSRTPNGSLVARTVTGQIITIGGHANLDAALAQKLIEQFDNLSHGLRANSARTIAWLKARGVRFEETAA